MDKISEDFSPHKQMSEHARIKSTDNTEDLRENPKQEKSQSSESSLFKKNYTGSILYCDYKCSRVTLVLPPSCWKKGI